MGTCASRGGRWPAWRLSFRCCCSTRGASSFLGPSAVRNGADVWLRQFLDTLGFSQYFLLPVLTIGLLLAWHYVARDRWQLSAGVVYGMLAETLCWA